MLKYGLSILGILLTIFGIVYNDVKRNLSFEILGIGFDGDGKLVVNSSVMNETFFNYVIKKVKIELYQINGTLITSSEEIEKIELGKGVNYVEVKFPEAITYAVDTAADGLTIAEHYEIFQNSIVEVSFTFAGIFVSTKTKVSI